MKIKRIRLAGKRELPETIKEDISMLFFCLAYILALIYVMKPNLMSGDVIITSYHRLVSIPKLIVAVITVLAVKHISYGLVNRQGTFPYYFVRLLFFLYEIPVILSLGLFGFENYSSFWCLEIMYWVLLCNIISVLSKIKVYKLYWKRTKWQNRLIRIATILLILIGLLYSFRMIGNISMSFSLSGIYRIRAAFKSKTNEIITFFKTAGGGYLCPAFIVFYFAKKQNIMAIAMIGLQCLFYFMARDKTYLFLLPVAMGIGLFYRSIVGSFPRYLRLGYNIYGISLLITVAGYLRNVVFEIITRRIHVMPCFFNYVYFDFFSQNEPVWWRQDTFLVDKLFSVVYPRSIPLQISHVYFHDLEGNPNAGMFAEAMSRCGYMGVLIYPILLGLLICVVGHYYRETSPGIQLILAVCFAMSISNDVITSTSFVVVAVLVLLGSRFFSNCSGLQLDKSGMAVFSSQDYRV